MDYVRKNEAWIPKLGFGTFNLTGREAIGILEFALDVGYRHFDTAQMYENEDVIGKVIGSTSVPRERLFITTKVWGTNLTENRFLPSVEHSLKELKQDYVDLLLIHWPNKNIPLEESLDQLMIAREKGYCKLIGVSNFTVELLEKVEKRGVDIVCNQFEYHPFLNQDKLLAKTREMGCFATAYAPLAKGQVVDIEILQYIALKHKVKPAQVALRWLVQQEDVVAIPKSSQLYRIKQNFDVFNFHLDEEDMEKISALQSKNMRLIDPEFAPTWD
ncbi:MAG TPA: aldo/keto reductase [Cryomorphaceae bacterium]|nr:2,5-didehydrogluconate reductase [Owenweeksia sp.]MBF97567.1 2,5-didehydrogluconate reductase [Owenweeksia sp.]HAD97430.1 aldo/keto reductase [Cryomorphaceae bacterium]HBF21404.1 aldo/keto reductase [Cryomorphaceae bacterium]HCQ16410.1 aldo/keto reductase [Cryomorphaceae bacterium]|tara:strand:- start:3840 stop:4658 length:819 start_codon:yes stop_codon:yes gene_type:complete